MKKCLVTAIFILSTIAVAQATPTLDRVVIGAGGGTATSGTIRLDLTFGEAVIGPANTSGVVSNFGFWSTVRPAVVGIDLETPLPVRYAINRAPNPFTTRTAITFAIPQGVETPVFLGIYDLNGRLIRTLVNETKAAGRHSITWDGRSDNGGINPAGVYFVTFTAANYHATHKVVMVK